MRILHFSTEDITGGAAKAAHRLQTALCEAGHQSQMVVLRKKSDDDHVIQAPPLEPHPWVSRFERLRQRVPGMHQQQPTANYTFNFDSQPQINFEALLTGQTTPPEIICLHWTNGLLNVKAIRSLYDYYRCPIVWVMADQEAMTGGCHYSFGCEGFTKECGNCPQLNPSHARDHSHVTWQRKKKNLADLPICFVAPSSWGKGRLQQSSLFRHHRCELIPYPIDSQIFRPFDQSVARDLLHLPLDKKIIFFGATYLEDRRKGMPQLLEAMNLLVTKQAVKCDKVFLLVAGLNGKHLMDRLPFEGKYIGQLNEDLTLALAYQAADIFVCPSIEDAGPLMIPEAMLSGTPVVAFNSGGAPDVIEHMANGYLASCFDADDLASGICLMLSNQETAMLRLRAHSAAARLHAPKMVADRYAELCRSLLNGQTAARHDAIYEAELR